MLEWVGAADSLAAGVDADPDPVAASPVSFGAGVGAPPPDAAAVAVSGMATLPLTPVDGSPYAVTRLSAWALTFDSTSSHDVNGCNAEAEREVGMADGHRVARRPGRRVRAADGGQHGRARRRGQRESGPESLSSHVILRHTWPPRLSGQHCDERSDAAVPETFRSAAARAARLRSRAHWGVSRTGRAGGCHGSLPSSVGPLAPLERRARARDRRGSLALACVQCQVRSLPATLTGRWPSGFVLTRSDAGHVEAPAGRASGRQALVEGSHVGRLAS